MSNAALAAPAPSRIWSPYQEAVFDFVADDSKKHAVIEAVAGGGKTSTIKEAVKHTWEGSKVLICAFNKLIAEELQRVIKVPGVTIKTLHSYGLGAVTRAHGKRALADDAYKARIAAKVGDAWEAREARTFVARAISAGKGTLAHDFDSLDATLDRMDIQPPKGFDRTQLITAACEILAETSVLYSGPITFDDMIWLPVVQRLNVTTFDYVFVDETQDLNPCQLQLVRMAAGARGRIIAVGDRRQAIYGFRGADVHAIPNMIRELNATLLPLSICYRCDAAIVAEAKELVPSIEAAPNADAGYVTEVSKEYMFRNAAPGDFVVSRINAPLVSLAFKWLAHGTKCTIRGRDIGEGLIKWIRNEKAKDIPMLLTAVSRWEQAEYSRLVALDRDTTMVTDRAECIRALCEGMPDVESLMKRCDALFSDNAGGGIQLMSTHKAKGLEADRVWLLIDTYCRRPGIEEDNLLYVGITRAKHELWYVTTQGE